MHGSVCDFLLDIIQNSIEASAPLVRISIEETGREIVFTIEDDGKGMDPVELAGATDPFFTDGKKHAARKVGLGLPFLIQTVEQVGGDFAIESRKGVGTRVRFSFIKDHVDCPPLGNLPLTVLAALTYPGDFEMVIRRVYRTDTREEMYDISRTELREALGGYETGGQLRLLKDFIISQEEELIGE